MPQNPKVILAHDSFTQLGGAERVIQTIHELYPEGPVYTLASNERVAQHLPGIKFKNSWLQKLYNFFPHLQFWFVLIPVVLRFFKVEKADILLSSSSAYIKGLRKPKGCLHINYCHTPTRFLWNDVVYAEGEVTPLLRPIMRLYFSWLRRWDLKAAKHVDHFIANSKEVQGRIKTYYNRDSELIYPAIDIDFWKPTIPKESYFLIAGRITPYKNYEKIIEIFNELNLPLHVIGSGRYLNYLKSIAKPNVSFYGRVSDEALRDQYSGALAFLYPQIEDFGLMPLEAASCGTPTIALAKAGSLETVVPKITGELLPDFKASTLEPVVKAITQQSYDEGVMRQHAAKFSQEQFKKQISEFVNKVYHAHHS